MLVIPVIQMWELWHVVGLTSFQKRKCHCQIVSYNQGVFRQQLARHIAICFKVFCMQVLLPCISFSGNIGLNSKNRLRVIIVSNVQAYYHLSFQEILKCRAAFAFKEQQPPSAQSSESSVAHRVTCGGGNSTCDGVRTCH